MGLDAHVRCNCAKQGRTKPFPFPGRLLFDQCGDPFLAGKNGSPCQDLEELTQFDQWEVDQGCEHRGYLVQARIGNMSYVASIRDWIVILEGRTGQRFPVALKKVLYNGTHSGDCLQLADVKTLANELNTLQDFIEHDYHREFVKNMMQLCEASLASGNPIAF